MTDRVLDRIDRRVLGAIRLVDRATRNIILRPITVKAQTATLIRNRSSLYVITEVDGLDDHSCQFLEQPNSPLPGSVSVELEVSDPLNRYLPRTVSVTLPRVADSTDLDNSDSLFQPMDVMLYASSNAKVLNNWSTVRASVTRNDVSVGVVPVRGCLLRVVRDSDNAVLASGFSDERGEVLIIVPGVPITQFADDDGDDSPVTVSELEIRLEVSHGESAQWPVNPDLLESTHVAGLLQTKLFSLKTGRMEKTTIELT